MSTNTNVKTYDVTVVRTTSQTKTFRVTAPSKEQAELWCADVEDEGDWAYSENETIDARVVEPNRDDITVVRLSPFKKNADGSVTVR